MTSRLICWKVVAVFVVMLAFCAVSKAQSCCAESPTSESSTFISAGTGYMVSMSMYEQVLRGGTGNYSGWTVSEEEGATGSDGCWSPTANPTLVPEYPAVAGSQWTVGSGNSWIPDYVGWYSTSVDYIRANSPQNSSTPTIPVFPCGYQVYQDLFIVCPGKRGPGENYDNTTQTGTVYSTYEENSREGVYSAVYY